MSGNLWEWCWDYYGRYPGPLMQDPAGPLAGKERVTRGGSYADPATSQRIARRAKVLPERRLPIVGLRLGRLAND